jgi:serine protease Do
MPREERKHSLGSGVMVSASGYVLTNNHVVEGASDIKVTLGDKREFKGRVIGTDPKTDIAVLKIEAKDFPVLIFADSAKVRVGDFALAIGNPFGLNQTIMGINMAYHEAGHALVTWYTPEADTVHKLTIIPHGRNPKRFVFSQAP